MKLASYNIRPFVVVLQEMPEKEKFIMAHFKERGMEAEPFNGISAAVAGLKTTHNYEVDAPGSGWNMGTKPVATWLSFYMLWSGLNLLPETHFATLEWDCQLPENWRARTEAALRDVSQDFDVLFIGSCCADGGPKKHVAGDVYATRHVQCGHFTILAHKALPVLLRTLRKVWAPLDIQVMREALPLLKTYAVLPRIANQFETVLPP